ncbi:MAG TPA: nucleotidyltransferase family protein [Casimicrobiaceae bacterium]|nr:nucleotidyltransferase family protein [Casimicrobiaceae bacterium]
MNASGDSGIGAMILAAGRGERMRPLSDETPKPLLVAGGKPLIVRQIERLREAGIRRIVINASHLAQRLQDALGDGAALGVSIGWSIEPEPLETAGGIATAFPLLQGPVIVVVSGDILTEFDYASLLPRAARMASVRDAPRVHLVMVPNPPYHPTGDFVLHEGTIRRHGPARVTFGNIALYDASLFAELPRGTKLKLLPLFERWIDAGIVSGELYAGRWSNVGTPEDLAALDHELRTQVLTAGMAAAL